MPDVAATNGHPTDDRDSPLHRDIRLLGRILGETVRDNDGENAFEVVEAVRRLSVAYQRRSDETAGRPRGTPVQTKIHDGETAELGMPCRRKA